MNKDKEELLEIVNEQDEVVGLESRKKIHVEGLLHREVHVWLVTKDGKIVFQLRAKDKDTYPDKLDASAGGHVDPGDTYDTAALRELEEETGIVATKEDLVFLGKERGGGLLDPKTGMTNTFFRGIYGYMKRVTVADLKIEEGKSQGYESWSISDLEHASVETVDRFIPGRLSEKNLEYYKKLLEETK